MNLCKRFVLAGLAIAAITFSGFVAPRSVKAVTWGECVPGLPCLDAGQKCSPKQQATAHAFRKIPGASLGAVLSIGTLECRRVGKSKKFRWRFSDVTEKIIVAYNGSFTLPYRASDTYYANAPLEFSNIRCEFRKGSRFINYDWTPGLASIDNALYFNCFYTVRNMSDVYDMLTPPTVTFRFFWFDSYASEEPFERTPDAAYGYMAFGMYHYSCTSLKATSNIGGNRISRTVQRDCEHKEYVNGILRTTEQSISYFGPRSRVEKKLTELSNSDWRHLAASLPVLVSIGSNYCFWLGTDSNTSTFKSYILSNKTERYGDDSTRARSRTPTVDCEML